ncbi:hypothetical protein C8Q73DRAFT_742828 [Cubamyces lactineus]|nr:hypothetical protein C8Q73DRAFT_742828 [Cubamyces lactineus]
MFTPILPAPTKHASGQHQYGTRTRSNSVIKPSARFRQSPDAPQAQRRIKPSVARKNRETSVAGPSSCPSSSISDTSPFPPPHVVLHPEDAGNKVFLALGRALMSISNRATTVKDLAELAMQHGLMCQNVSAAGQAITTFIRNHYTRCEQQDDQPLLLKHHMSGTIYDDDLVPALHSRSGGAHCTNNGESQSRLTNFRRGTQVWYLSKAAGAPCPFATAGIRICDYSEDGKVGTVPNPGRERKRERDRLRKAAQACGQKRKRLPRSCADKEPLASDSSDAEDERPPKVKLTLRLRPCLTPTVAGSSACSVRSLSRSTSPQINEDVDLDDSEDESESDSMSVQDDDDDDDSCGIHPSSPSAQGLAIRRFSLPDDLPPSGYPRPSDPYQRSASLPYSEVSGSPPPDSEVEDDDYHITMTDSRRLYARSSVSSDDEDSAWDGDFFADLDADAETQWDSPGPRSPSVQIEDEVVVKEEPTDVRGLLDAWENLESRATDLKVIDVVAQAAAAEREFEEQAGSDDLLKWTWPGMQTGNTEHIKQEEFEPDLLLFDNEFSPPNDVTSPLLPYDPYDSPVEECSHKFDSSLSFEPQWRDVEILGPDSVKPRDLEDGVWHEYRARPSTPEEQAQPFSSEPLTTAAASLPTSPRVPRVPLPPLDVKSADVGAGLTEGRHPSITSPSLIASLTSLTLRTPTTSTPTLCPSSRSPATNMPSTAVNEDVAQTEEPFILHTIDPLIPAIFATQFEGVPVYQMSLGTSTFLRRIDSDFVNITPIAQYLGTQSPLVPNAVVVSGGSPGICGSWVPLGIARSTAEDALDFRTFLSEDLRTLFPASIHVLCSGVGSKAPCTGFGHQFNSASDARRRSMASHRLELPPREFEASWEDHLSTHPPFILATSAIDGHHSIPEEEPPVVEALSPTEEEMFHVLCADPEWDSINSTMDGRGTDMDETDVAQSRPTDPLDGAQERPLRRSKRVAASAVATRSRTRSSKRGSRTSLS